jgi:hypothetical protein
MIKRTDNELGKTRQKTNYLATQRSKGSMNKGTFSSIPDFNMEFCRNIMVKLNSLFHSPGGVGFNDE